MISSERIREQLNEAKKQRDHSRELVREECFCEENAMDRGACSHCNSHGFWQHIVERCKSILGMDVEEFHIEADDLLSEVKRHSFFRAVI